MTTSLRHLSHGKTMQTDMVRRADDAWGLMDRATGRIVHDDETYIECSNVQWSLAHGGKGIHEWDDVARRILSSVT